MPHNPIKQKHQVGRADLGFVIQLGTVGVFYQGERFIRLLAPGDSPSLSERLSLGGLAVHVVDMAPHALTWRVSLPAKGNKDAFSVTVNLKYQIEQPRRMVEEQVSDTELSVMRLLEPVLSRVSREFALNQHRAADAALEACLTQADLPGRCGVRLVETPAVVIQLSEDDHRRIKWLEDLDRAMRVPQPAQHVDQVPSQDKTYKFRVTVSLKYKVYKPDELPYDSLKETEQELWPALRRILTQKSRKHNLLAIEQAAEEMQQALDEQIADGIREYGLQVLNAQLDVDFDEVSGKRFAELAEIEHAKTVEIARLRGLPFYFEMAKQGSWAVVAMAATKGEISLKELAAQLTDRERESLQTQIKLLSEHRPENFGTEAEGIRLLDELTSDIGDRLRRPKDTVAPMYDDSAPALPDARKKSKPKETEEPTS